MGDTKVTTVTLELLDGRAFKFDTKTYLCAADRVAFEKRFGVSSSALMRVGQRMGLEAGSGELDPAAEEKLRTEGLPDEMDESWIMFFAWRAASRAEPEVFGHMPFDHDPDDEHPFGGFVQQLADYDTPKDEAGAGVDPTTDGAPSE